MFWESSFPFESEVQNLATDATAGISTAFIQVAPISDSYRGSVQSVSKESQPGEFFPVILKSKALPVETSRNKNEKPELLRINETKTAAYTVMPLVPFWQLAKSNEFKQFSPGQPDTDQKSKTPTKFGQANAHKEAINVSRSNSWSGYFWVFARQGSSDIVSANSVAVPRPGGGQYGGSQAGAILAYRVSGTRKSGLSLFSRVTSPLAVTGDAELALGSFIKPSKNLPLALYVEQRFGHAGRLDRGTAVYIAGGSGPDQLTENVSLETYGQTGYLLDEQNSYFFDGSVSLQNELLSQGLKRVSIGGGIWAGGQKNVSRLDIGPRVNVELPIGAMPTRVSVDWRHRVAGNARPGSGLAVSVSTGF